MGRRSRWAWPCCCCDGPTKYREILLPLPATTNFGWKTANCPHTSGCRYLKRGKKHTKVMKQQEKTCPNSNSRVCSKKLCQPPPSSGRPRNQFTHFQQNIATSRYIFVGNVNNRLRPKRFSNVKLLLIAINRQITKKTFRGKRESMATDR